MEAVLNSLRPSEKDRELSELKRNHKLVQDQLTNAKQQWEYLHGLHTLGGRENLALNARIETLEGELQACKNELRACKDDLFRMQPTSHIPDSKVASQYDDLVQGICTWIDAEIARYSDEWQKTHIDEPPKLFHHGGDYHAKELLVKHHETVGEHFIRAMVQRLLYKTVFKTSMYLFGLGSKLAEALQNAEAQMQLSNPPKDLITIRAWRSETLTALAAASTFTESVEKKRDHTAQRIFDDLQCMFPIIKGDHTSLLTFYEKIVQPAVDLAVAVQTSPTPYSFFPRMTSTKIYRRLALSKDDMTRARMIDAATAKTLRADSPIVERSDGFIGEQIALLSPALVRNTQGGTPVYLTQAVILVELYYPLGRRRTALPKPAPLPTSNKAEPTASSSNKNDSPASSSPRVIVSEPRKSLHTYQLRGLGLSSRSEK